MKLPRHFVIVIAAALMFANSAEASMATRFVKMRRVPAEEASRWIGRIFETPLIEDPDHIPLQTVPAPRTNEVFIMGRIVEMDLATALLQIADGRFSFSLLK
jgi:hypothetical protein